ncbi:TRAP transporter substrate-binding protein [Atopobacter phocae]|uniref:TRAP transporter substrate-binding protein n=1 Tax=Atopobacter phocae TaxID=136492 RepID=UPI0004B1BBDB|nr:TRAP transporter substrate-binding protein [Atopobacter phocae]
MKNNKRFTNFLILFLCSFILGACSNKDSLQNVSISQKIVRVAHGQPINHPDHIAMLKFAEHINEHLGDKYKVVVYDNGLLGDTKNALELAQTGAIDYVISSTSNLESFNNAYGLFSLPYLFINEKAYFDFMNSKLSERLYNSTEKSGLRAVTWFNAGSRNFYGSKPYTTPEDLKGEKIRVQPSPLNVAMMKALGAGAVPMSFGEVYTALQQGTIDGAENNELALNTVKHGEVVDFYTYDEHQRQPDMLIASTRFLNSLNSSERKIFNEATELAHKTELREWEKAVLKAKEDGENMGVKFVEADIPAFQYKVKKIHKEYLNAEKNSLVYYEEIEKLNNEHK